jgi:hypothetical protein
MNTHYVGQGFRWFIFYAIGLLLAMSAVFVGKHASAAVTAEWRVNLVKGTTTVSPPSTGATQEAAWAACQARIPTSAATTATYKCQTPVYVAIVSADPPPPTCAPPQPADLTQPGQCPTGTSGSWTQRKAFSCVGTTWTAAAEWTPLSAPEGVCVAIPPPPPPAAPQNLTGVATQNQTNPANSNVKLTWTAVTGATAYEVERCTVTSSGCTFGWLADTAVASFSNNNLPPGITYRYRVRTWTPPPAGPYSAVFTITIPASTPPPPPLGSARLEWTKPPTNDDGTALTNLAGYTVLFGLGTAALSQQITVPNAAATQYEVTGLAPGTWFFAVRAYATSGVESVSSNVVSKQLP